MLENYLLCVSLPTSVAVDILWKNRLQVCYDKESDNRITHFLVTQLKGLCTPNAFNIWRNNSIKVSEGSYFNFIQSTVFSVFKKNSISHYLHLTLLYF